MWMNTDHLVLCGQSVKVVYSSDQSSGTDHWLVLMQRSNEEMRTHLQNRIDYVKNVIGPRIGLPFIQPPVGQRSNTSGVKSGTLEAPFSGIWNVQIHLTEHSWCLHNVVIKPEIESTYLTCGSHSYLWLLTSLAIQTKW